MSGLISPIGKVLVTAIIFVVKSCSDPDLSSFSIDIKLEIVLCKKKVPMYFIL